jgi:hypothetical protein
MKDIISSEYGGGGGGTPTKHLILDNIQFPNLWRSKSRSYYLKKLVRMDQFLYPPFFTCYANHWYTPNGRLDECRTFVHAITWLTLCLPNLYRRSNQKKKIATKCVTPNPEVHVLKRDPMNVEPLPMTIQRMTSCHL